MTVEVRRISIGNEEEVADALSFAALDARSDPEVGDAVRDVIAAVRRDGDRALLSEVRRHDWDCPDEDWLRVRKGSLAGALASTDSALLAALEQSAESIREFHRRQHPGGGEERAGGGMRAGIRTLPLDSVGLYVPGGLATYPSTLLMLAIPAQLAGVRRIAVASPAGREGTPAPIVMATAAMLGLDEMWAVGGAGAIAAFAFGTKSIARVDKILGPGNAWVAEAKRQVFGHVGIDSVAGPTELVILSDGGAPARYLAADLLAQAEHDPRASAILLTTDPAEPERVAAELAVQLGDSPRAPIQVASLARRGALVSCARPDVAWAAARHLAPEHLSVMAADAHAWAAAVPTAAAIFIGPFAPEAAGDYGAGPNHSLPTGGTARFSSPVGIWDYVRQQSYLELDRAALARLRGFMDPLAEAEGLHGHARSLAVRDDPAE